MIKLSDAIKSKFAFRLALRFLVSKGYTTDGAFKRLTVEIEESEVDVEDMIMIDFVNFICSSRSGFELKDLKDKSEKQDWNQRVSAEIKDKRGA